MQLGPKTVGAEEAGFASLPRRVRSDFLLARLASRIDASEGFCALEAHHVDYIAVLHEETRTFYMRRFVFLYHSTLYGSINYTRAEYPTAQQFQPL